ncbi:MAG: cytochrome c peroxidase [Methylicorpusculum sp.]|uniref:cytochrome-c peroxidase n=1 Tax=Methylicorpusculum sp. TaxID=2713644 RepID=UPI00271CE8F1|nr:cytochrome c peroxidase [Methylicorpusculum sp.]MDO8938207.1 cytochrome c peroxidase [Methylicorpusculum sp.]MDP2202138.1 cytochrome c peroxidase [Methylicorpusculum sp.]
MLAEIKNIFSVALVAALIGAPDISQADDADMDLKEQTKALFGIIMPALSDNPDVLLGQALFWDARVSGDGKTACVSCHQAEDWGADRRTFSPDAKGKLTSRNAQTVFNAMMQPTLRWTGDRTSGAHQAEKSLTGSMGFSSADAVIPVLASLGYEAAFKAAFPEASVPISPSNYAKALQAYQATLLTPAPFDHFLSGDDSSLTVQQKEGLALFIKTGCASCHSGPLLGGNSIQKFGVVKDYWSATRSEKRDPGRFDATQNEADLYTFRVSMLRNIAKTAPYFHDGSVAELEQAVRIMAEVQLGTILSDSEVKSIVAFLESLTGDLPVNYKP